MNVLPNQPWCVITFFTENGSFVQNFSSPVSLADLILSVQEKFGENYRCYTNKQGTLKRLRKDSEFQKLVEDNCQNVQLIIKLSRTLSKSESPHNSGNFSSNKPVPTELPLIRPKPSNKKRGHRRTHSAHASYPFHTQISYIPESLTPDFDSSQRFFPFGNEGGMFVPDAEVENVTPDSGFQSPDNPYNSSSSSTVNYDLPLHLLESEVPSSEQRDSFIDNNKDIATKSDISSKCLDSEFLSPIQYKITKLIGRGGFAEVHHCVHRDTGREMAVKTVPLIQDGVKSSKELTALYNEMDIMKKLKHNHIVAYLGCTTQNATLKIFMEYISGGSMRSYIDQNGALSDKFTKRCLYHILSGLSYLHGHQISHRDLKAANVLKTTSGIIKIADFGASKRIKTITTSINSVTGTPYWMAPEVIKESGKFLFQVK